MRTFQARARALLPIPRISILAVWVLGIAVLAACSTDSILPDRRPDYRQAKVLDPLEAPPDLTKSTIDESLLVPELSAVGSASLSAYASERTARGRTAAPESVLPEQAGVRMARDGGQRWLVVDAPPEEVWPRIKEFWASNGFLLEREDPRIGIMETEWAENRADIPSDAIRNLLGKVIDFAYSAPTRDKFRVRIERADQGTEVYLTHYGLEEVARDVRVVWQNRPSDPELEVEMLNRLMAYLGAAERRERVAAAKPRPAEPAAPRTRLVRGSGGQEALIIEERYGRAWRLVGLALDGSGFAVEDQDRAQGLYVVEYRDPEEEAEGEEGILSGLAFWKDDTPPPAERYQVRLSGQGPKTVVYVFGSEGQPESSDTAHRILQSVESVIR